jgi:hypothetical protein
LEEIVKATLLILMEQQVYGGKNAYWMQGIGKETP